MNNTSHQKNLWLGQHHLHRVLNPQKDQLVDDKYVLYIQMYIRLDNFSGNSDKKSGKTCFCSEKFLNFRIAKQTMLFFRILCQWSQEGHIKIRRTISAKFGSAKSIELLYVLWFEMETETNQTCLSEIPSH